MLVKMLRPTFDKYHEEVTFEPGEVVMVEDEERAKAMIEMEAAVKFEPRVLAKEPVEEEPQEVVKEDAAKPTRKRKTSAEN